MAGEWTCRTRVSSRRHWDERLKAACAAILDADLEGASAVQLAPNNHSLNYGEYALHDTLELLHAAGALPQ